MSSFSNYGGSVIKSFKGLFDTLARALALHSSCISNTGSNCIHEALFSFLYAAICFVFMQVFVDVDLLIYAKQAIQRLLV